MTSKRACAWSESNRIQFVDCRYNQYLKIRGCFEVQKSNTDPKMQRPVKGNTMFSL